MQSAIADKRNQQREEVRTMKKVILVVLVVLALGVAGVIAYQAYEQEQQRLEELEQQAERRAAEQRKEDRVREAMEDQEKWVARSQRWTDNYLRQRDDCVDSRSFFRWQKEEFNKHYDRCQDRATIETNASLGYTEDQIWEAIDRHRCTLGNARKDGILVQEINDFEARLKQRYDVGAVSNEC